MRSGSGFPAQVSRGLCLSLLPRCILVVLLLLPLNLLADELVVVTGEKSALTALDKNQVRNIFLGKRFSLPDGSNATPVDQPESSSLRKSSIQK
jgi:hypothetical protein